jgi:RNA ligase (TIGR02306 family)
MAEHRLVTIEKITKVTEHPNADKLDIVDIQGWQCVTQKGVYKKNEIVIYFHIDSILPVDIEKRIFGPDAKITLNKHRIRAIKIRSMLSYGLVVPISLFSDLIKDEKVNDDVTNIFKVTKYEPIINKKNILYVNRQKKRYENPNFKKVRKPERLSNYKGCFDGKEVMITEKIHGTSCKVGWVLRPNNTWKEKLIIKLFGNYQFVYRTMEVQLQKHDTIMDKILTKIGIRKYKGYYKDINYGNVYAKIVNQYELKVIISPGYEIAFEIYGSKIQKNYTYGLKHNEHKMAVYAVIKDGKYLPPHDAYAFCEIHKLPHVPILYIGMFSNDELNRCTVGVSVLDPNTKVREGCCIVPLDGKPLWMGKEVMKSINPYYELKNQTEYN